MTFVLLRHIAYNQYYMLLRIIVAVMQGKLLRYETNLCHGMILNCKFYLAGNLGIWFWFRG